MFHESIEANISCFAMMEQGNKVPPVVAAAFLSAFLCDAIAMCQVYRILQKLRASSGAAKKMEAAREQDFIIRAKSYFLFDGISGRLS